MASATRIPKVSRISRGRTLAYARKQKPTEGGGDGPDEPAPEPGAAPGDAPKDTTAPAASAPAPAASAPALAASVPALATSPTAAPPAPGPAAPSAGATAAAPSSSPGQPAPAPSPTAAPPAPGPAAPSTAPAGAAPSPAIAPAAGVPVAPTPAAGAPVEPARARVETAAMPPRTSVGEPPAMPAAGAAPAIAAGAVEDLTRMPGPREIPGGQPDDPAAPPGRVPPGDSRSLRRRADRHEFALVYRVQTHVISRIGVVGTRGQWRVVEYPTPAMASHAYAKECSRLVTEGFSDYRE